MMKQAGGRAADEATSKTKEMAVAKADEITGIDTQAHFGEAMSLWEQMQGIIFAPAAGGLLFVVLYRLLVLIAIAFFVYTFSASAAKFDEKVTQYEVEYLTEYQYPDIYHCIPATVMAQTILKKGLDTDKNPFTSVDAKNIEDDILAALVYATLPDKDQNLPCGVLGWGIMNASSPAMQTGACPYTNSSIGASKFINESRFRVWSYKDIPSGSNNNAVGLTYDDFGDRYANYPSVTEPTYDATATKLAKMLPTAIRQDGDAEEVIYAHCELSRSTATAKVSYLTNDILFLARTYGMFGFMHQAEPKTPVVNLFLVEPGGSPFKTVNGNEVIGVQSVPIVIGNMDSTTRVSPRQMKDETIGETKYTTTYRIENQLQAPHFMATTAGFFKPGCTGNMNPGATSNNAGKTKASCALNATISTEERLEYLEKWYSASKYLDNFATVTLGFYMQQEKITVRWKTVSEIWAEIGALWAGATMVIGWFFVKSGFLDKHGREAQVFIYQTDSTRKQQIAGLTAKGMVAIEKDESIVVATDVATPSSV